MRKADKMGEDETNDARYPWAGPALFTSVAVALVVFFWWFLSASAG